MNISWVHSHTDVPLTDMAQEGSSQGRVSLSRWCTAAIAYLLREYDDAIYVIKRRRTSLASKSGQLGPPGEKGTCG